MTLRMGQKLVNYVRFQKLGQESGWKAIPDSSTSQALVARYIFNMSDKEFQEALLNPCFFCGCSTDEYCTQCQIGHCGTCEVEHIQMHRHTA